MKPVHSLTLVLAVLSLALLPAHAAVAYYQVGTGSTYANSGSGTHCTLTGTTMVLTERTEGVWDFVHNGGTAVSTQSPTCPYDFLGAHDSHGRIIGWPPLDGTPETGFFAEVQDGCLYYRVEIDPLGPSTHYYMLGGSFGENGCVYVWTSYEGVLDFD